MYKGILWDPNTGPGVISYPWRCFDTIRCTNVRGMKELIYIRVAVEISSSIAIVAMLWTRSTGPLNIPFYESCSCVKTANLTTFRQKLTNFNKLTIIFFLLKSCITFIHLEVREHKFWKSSMGMDFRVISHPMLLSVSMVHTKVG